jgi:hypothetical protein
MVAGKDFEDAITRVRASGKDITFAELIADILKGKIVEVYIGETYEDRKLEEISSKTPSVLIGKVICAYAECLVLDCAYIDESDNSTTVGSKRLLFGNIVCLNERAVRTITEVDGTGMLKDTFLSSKDNKAITALNKSMKGK